MLIVRWLVVLCLIIISGIILVEREINTLTLQQEFVKSFNIRREGGAGYAAYVLGQRYSVDESAIGLNLHDTEREMLKYKSLFMAMFKGVEAAKNRMLASDWYKYCERDLNILKEEFITAYDCGKAEFDKQKNSYQELVPGSK